MSVIVSKLESDLETVTLMFVAAHQQRNILLLIISLLIQTSQSPIELVRPESLSVRASMALNVTCLMATIYCG